MDLVQSQPELASQLSETRVVLTPAQVEVLGAVLPSLEDSPPPSVCGHVAVNRESSFAVRIDRVRATCGGAGFVKIRAVPWSWTSETLVSGWTEADGGRGGGGDVVAIVAVTPYRGPFPLLFSARGYKCCMHDHDILSPRFVAGDHVVRRLAIEYPEP